MPMRTTPGTDNTYKVVVVASDDAMGVTGRMMGYKKSHRHRHRRG